MTTKTELAPVHTSPETAYLVDDYPYGFRLRCKIRYWVETKEGFGQRLVSQTTNPKREGTHWNKPKASQYCPLVALYLDENQHLVSHGLRQYGDAGNLDEYIAAFPLTCATEYAVKRIKLLRISMKAASYITYKIHTPGEPEQTKEEANNIYRKAFVHAAHEIAKEQE